MDGKKNVTVYALLFRKPNEGSVDICLGLNKKKDAVVDPETGIELRPEKRMGWGIVAGGMDDGETPRQTAAREGEEEAGFPASLLTDLLVAFPNDEPFEEKPTHAKYFFVTEIPTEWGNPEAHDPEMSGVTTAKWVSVRDILVPDHEVLFEGFPIYNSHRKLVRWYLEDVPIAPRVTMHAPESRDNGTMSRRSTEKERLRIPRPEQNNIYTRRARGTRGKR